MSPSFEGNANECNDLIHCHDAEEAINNDIQYLLRVQCSARALLFSSRTLFQPLRMVTSHK